MVIDNTSKSAFSCYIAISELDFFTGNKRRTEA